MLSSMAIDYKQFSSILTSGPWISNREIHVTTPLESSRRAMVMLVSINVETAVEVYVQEVASVPV